MIKIYKRTRTGTIEKIKLQTSKELIVDLNKRISIIKKIKDLVKDQMGKVSVSYDTELLVMCDYCDYLIVVLEKRIWGIKKEGLK